MHFTVHGYQALIWLLIRLCVSCVYCFVHFVTMIW